MNRIELFVSMLIACLLPFGCSTPQKITQPELNTMSPKAYLEASKIPPPGPPPFKEKSSPELPPLPEKTRLYTLKFDGAPLGRVLQVLAREAGLNLILEEGLDLARPIFVQLTNATLDESLMTILTEASDYAYRIKGNSLIVKRFEDVTFTLPYPYSKRKTKTKVGGDILEGGVGGGEGGGGTTSVTSEFTIESEETEEQADLWNQIQTGLKALKSQEGRLIIQPYAGIIFVSDHPSRIALMRKFLDQIRKVMFRQVLIEAKILEVQLNDRNQAGIRWDLLNKYFSITGENGAFTLIENLGSGIASGTGSDISHMGTGGAVGATISSGNTTFDILVDFLQSQGDVRVLSNPHIAVLNGQSAVITVGSQYPFGDVNGVTVDQYGNVTFDSRIKRALLGLQLGITPRIAEDGEILLHIVPSITNLQGEAVVDIPTTGEAVQQIRNPIIDLRQMGTVVRVREGQSVVLAGLMRQDKTNRRQSIPILGNVPILGVVFRNQDIERRNTELVVVVTPRLIPPQIGRK